MDMEVNKGMEYMDSLHEEDLQRIGELLDCNINNLSMRDILFKLEHKCKSQQREIEEHKNDVDRATKLLEQSVIRQKELHRVLEHSNRLSEYTISEAGKLLGDFELEDKLNTGQVTVDKILANVIEKAAKSQAGLEKFTKQRLKAAGYQLKEGDGADTVVCNLLMKIDSDKKKIDALQGQINVAHCKNEMNTISDNTLVLLEQSLPKQFDAQTMSLQRDQQMLDVNIIIGSLLQTIEGMKNTLIQCKKEFDALKTTKRNPVISKSTMKMKTERDLLICKMRSEGATQDEIAEALGVSRGTVYNALKKQR